MNTPYSTNSSSYSTLDFAYFSSGDDPKVEVRCEMEVDAAHTGMDKLTEALDTLAALKMRLGDMFSEKKYRGFVLNESARGDQWDERAPPSGNLDPAHGEPFDYLACGYDAITQVPAARWNVHAQPAISESIAIDC